MLDRIRKRIEDLITAVGSAEEDTEAPGSTEDYDEASAEDSAGPGSELEAAMLARKEAKRREARLILSERIHNRASTLISELRDRLLNQLEQRLEEEGSRTLQRLLQVTLDPAFTQRLDETIDEDVDDLVKDLQQSFEGEQESLSFLPSKSKLSDELKSYRDQVLRTHVLEQVEVYALPSRAFLEGETSPAELKEQVAQYWKSCRDALDRFFRSVEMALLNGARPGIRIDSSIIRERLVAAQYRNGYRALEDRFRTIYSKIVQQQMKNPQEQLKEKALRDRQFVDEIVVPLAYFIRDRSEPEPLEALTGRARLFREIVDKLVTSGAPFVQTAESIKPLLRRSIQQARPHALERFPYLRPYIESLKPTEIHRATALLHLLEVLVSPEIDERTIQTVEQSVRLNKWQYHLHVQLWNKFPEQLRRLQPLDRIDDQDAELMMEFIERMSPTPDAVEDIAVRLAYLNLPTMLPEDDPKLLLRILAIITIPRDELLTWHFLYAPEPASKDVLERLAGIVLEQIRPTSVGADDRQHLVEAVPFPVDLSKALKRALYDTKGGDRLTEFRSELKALITSGTSRDLVRAIERIQKLRKAVDRERISVGLVETEGHPYVSEVWLKESGEMVGLLFFRGEGFGLNPIEMVTRDPSNGNRGELNQKLRRQLTSQAIIYKTFFELFGFAVELQRPRRQALPTYLKTTYEKIEPNRHSLLGHLRNAGTLLKRIGEFSQFISEAEPSARAEVVKVERILSGFERKVDELLKAVEKSTAAAELGRYAREYERVLRYVNVVILHSVNPWLARQTEGLATEFDFRQEEVIEAIRDVAAQHGIDWENDVERHEVHRIRGTLGCRALLRLADGSSKAVLLEYDRRRRIWRVKHFGPRITEVVAEQIKRLGRSMPNDYDEKYEQPTFSLDEQSCRFLLTKRNVLRIEATLVLDATDLENPWRVVYLKWNDEILIDRGTSLAT